MELSDLAEDEELSRGTVLTREQLEAYGLYNTDRKLGKQIVYNGKNKGTCILDQIEEDKFRVYIHKKSSNTD